LVEDLFFNLEELGSRSGTQKEGHDTLLPKKKPKKQIKNNIIKSRNFKKIV
jgi:hypothetical protein